MRDALTTRLSEALMAVAEELATTAVAGRVFVPEGTAVRAGRISLSKLIPAGTEVAVAVGFTTACWVGPAGASVPPLGRLVHHARARIDAKGRLNLDRRVRAYLDVPDPACFEVAVVSAVDVAGVVLIPIHDFARRLEDLTRDDRR